jgi:hypothetical protein
MDVKWDLILFLHSLIPNKDEHPIVYLYNM